jgi:hypothetical protein
MFKRDTNSLKRQSTTMPAVPATTGAGKRTSNLGTPPISEGVNFTEFGCTVLTEMFQAKGKLHSIGGLSTFLNDEQKPSVSVFSAEILGLLPNNPATRIVSNQLIIIKGRCEIIALDVMPDPAVVVVPSRYEILAMYTDQYAIQAKFHMGPDSRLSDFVEAGGQQFIVATEARIFPLFQPRIPVLSSAPFLFVHRASIQMYHEVQSK